MEHKGPQTEKEEKHFSRDFRLHTLSVRHKEVKNNSAVVDMEPIPLVYFQVLSQMD